MSFGSTFTYPPICVARNVHEHKPDELAVFVAVERAGRVLLGDIGKHEMGFAQCWSAGAWHAGSVHALAIL